MRALEAEPAAGDHATVTIQAGQLFITERVVKVRNFGRHVHAYWQLRVEHRTASWARW